MSPYTDEINFSRLLQLMANLGVRRLLAKVLAPNDNSKNQPYLGGDFSVLNVLPAGQPEAATTGAYAAPIFKASLRFGWLSDDGSVATAPNAKLILYPQYPEVRFSGYLRGCAKAPSQLMGATRQPGRLLFMGIRDDGGIVGYAAGPESQVARGFAALRELQQIGIFLQVPLPGVADAAADRTALLSELCRISGEGWITAKKLNADGTLSQCSAPNCGGYTLEAELGISPNGSAEPDFRGWEVKQHAVNNFIQFRGGPVTLMTPEPSAGFYATAGVVAFVERYGYLDTKGREDRWNFGGIHRCESLCARSGLTLKLLGYDAESNKITDSAGGIALVDGKGRRAAIWLYSDLMGHWNRKHATAAYVSSMSRDFPSRQYRYANRLRLGIGTDFLKFLAAMSAGRVYYDPGIKVENYSSPTRRTKRRSQFRIGSQDVDSLYEKMEIVDACSP